MIEDWQFAGLHCPIPAADRPDSADFDHYAFSWIRDYNLIDRTWLYEMEKAAPLTLLAAACPEGIAERMHVVAAFWLWAFAFDDIYFDGGIYTDDPAGACRLIQPLLRVLEMPQESMVHDDAWAAALRSVRLQFENSGTALQIHRWAGAAREMLFSFVRESAYIRLGTLPGLREYLTLRMETSGAKHHLLLVDFIHGYELKYEQLAIPSVRAASEACCVLLGIDNDLFSYSREKATEGPVRLNAIDVLARDRNMPTQQAFAEVVRIRNRIASGFTGVCADVVSTAGPDLTHYISSLGHWVRANLDWSSRTRRYFTPTEIAPLALPHLFINECDTTVSNKARWWECLD